MSGVAGWVDYARDLTRDAAIVRAMAATMANRGPDGEGVWAGTRAALGHREVRTTDDASGTQPFVAERDGRPVAVATFMGDVYNGDELRAELGSRGHTFRGRTDVEVVVTAYLEWGAQCAEHLDGTFGFAVWDLLAEELLLVRDRLGTKPLYYYPTATGVVFGTERKAVLAHPQVLPAVDEDGLRELLAQAGTPGEAVFHGMRQLPSGHVLRVHRGGHKEVEYWKLTATPHTDDLDTTVATIRAMLEDAVPRHLVSDVPLGTMLSGGLDSSTVTCLSAKALRERGAGPIKVFTVSFKDQAEKFRADETYGTADDPFVADVAKHVGAELHIISLSPEELMDPLPRLATLQARDVPSPLGNMNTSLYLLCRELKQHVTVALHGDPSDAVFGGFPWVFAPEIMNAETLPWVARAHSAGGKSGFGGDLLDRDLLKRLDLRGYSADRYQQALAEVPYLGSEQGVEKKMREISHMHLTRWLEILLGQSENLSAAHGIDIRWPYATHRLVEYVFNIPWELKNFSGMEKSLLRAAAKDVLPESVFKRHKSPFPVTQDPAYGQLLCAELEELLNSPNAPAASLLDAEACRDVIADPTKLEAGGAAWVSRANIEMLLQLNTWLENYNVRVLV
jgi:asparagine synthase (glutamine-hydrolysing)